MQIYERISMNMHNYSTSIAEIDILQAIGAMQGQRGTFGFHEQGESTRLKIYLYVSAI